MGWFKNLFKKIVYKENKGPTNGRSLTIELREEYLKMYKHLNFKKDKLRYIGKICDIMIENKDKYLDIENETRVPWFLIACIDNMESGMDPQCQLFNGQKFTKVTTLVPKGKGPWPTWRAAAIECMGELDEKYKFDNWGLAEILYACECHNGLFYRRWVNHITKSPYLWGMSNFYEKGGFPRDHVWDRNYKSQQCGCATIIKLLEQRGEITL